MFRPCLDAEEGALVQVVRLARHEAAPGIIFFHFGDTDGRQGCAFHAYAQVNAGVADLAFGAVGRQEIPLAQAALAGKRVLNMATIAPHEARTLREEVEAAGGELMECTVLGSIPEARSGSLILMVGGTAEQFDAAQPLLTAFGSSLRVGLPCSLTRFFTTVSRTGSAVSEGVGFGPSLSYLFDGPVVGSG